MGGSAKMSPVEVTPSMLTNLRLPVMRAAGLAVLVLGAWPAAAGAAYRCVAADGRVSFQDTPCPRTEKESKLQLPAGATAAPRDAVTRAAAGAAVDPHVRMAAAMERERRGKDLEFTIGQVEERIARRNAAMSDQVAELQHRKGYARNNLAGATWQNSLSGEMQAIVDQTRALNQADEERLKVLRADLEATRRSAAKAP